MLDAKFGGELLQLLPQRGVYRPSNSTLYIADTHWGKDASFRALHVPLPTGGLQDDLKRLSEALEITGAERLVVLGDLTHSHHSFSEQTVARVAAWRMAHGECAVQLVVGNHDREVENLPVTWAIETLAPPHNDDGFLLTHFPEEHPNAFVLCGHLHPLWCLVGRGKQSLRLPCFIQTKGMLILPAFSTFTGATANHLHGVRRVYGITGEHVLQVR
jgi:uncharacterized protein